MASIIRDPNGRKRIQFMCADGVKRAIRLGKVELRHAESIRVKIETLLSAAITRQPLDRETALWLAEIDDDLHEKLAGAKLIEPRLSRSLGLWLDDCRTAKASLKPESLRKLEQTMTKLLEFFDSDTAMHRITAEQASRWRDGLAASGLSIAAVKTHAGNAKTIFREAVARGIIEESPFAHLKGGVTPTRNDRYVTPEEAAKVIAACPDEEWQLLVGLARYAGLRVPSETHLLTRPDVNLESSQLRVRSPKTERYEGHEERFVPICPRLRALLERRLQSMPGDQLITIRSAGGRRRKMKAIMEAAGIAPWDDTWQTLRRSCEIEWAQRYPQYAVSRWIGHSITVSGRHYANAIPASLYDQVAERVTQKATQHPAETASIDEKAETATDQVAVPKSFDCQELQRASANCQIIEEWSRGESNPRAVTVRMAPLRVYLTIDLGPGQARQRRNQGHSPVLLLVILHRGAAGRTSPMSSTPAPSGVERGLREPVLGRESVIAVGN